MTRNGQGVLDGIRVLRLIDKMPSRKSTTGPYPMCRRIGNRKS